MHAWWGVCKIWWIFWFVGLLCVWVCAWVEWKATGSGIAVLFIPWSNTAIYTARQRSTTSPAFALFPWSPKWPSTFFTVIIPHTCARCISFLQINVFNSFALSCVVKYKQLALCFFVFFIAKLCWNDINVFPAYTLKHI